MRQLFLLFLTFLLIPSAKAEMKDSFWFEPTLACVVGGAVGYVTSKKGNELTYSSIGCLIGGGVMYMVGSYYETKVSSSKNKEIDELRKIIKFQEQIQAQSSAKGDATGVYSLRVQEVVPAQKLPDGSVMAPTIKETLVLPTNHFEVGY